MDTTQTRSFVRTVLPWIVAAVMLLLYLFTLNTNVTAHSIWPLARASGLDWHVPYLAPLTYLVTFPIRGLPPSVQLFGLNFMSALFAALSLAVLARSVAILPHDRTQLQREKCIDENGFLGLKLAWLPVVFAVIAAGLQLSFWENAVVGTGEMLDLLLFAYCVRCLLEFRIEEKNSWLYRLAVVYGVGITNNYAMIAFLPALLVSLVWVKGWRFFRFDFLVKMFLLGLAGLSLYLLFPLLNLGEVHFWGSLKANLSYQKQIVFGLRRAALLPAIYCLVPLVLMAIKWSGGFGDQSATGSSFANVAAVLLHVGLLVFCIYVLFDPPVSPRQIAAQYLDTGVRFVFLPAYYLGALIIGYYSGFLLLVFSKPDTRLRRPSIIPAALNYPVTALVCLAAAFVAGRLFYENLPRIRTMNSRALRDYAQALVQSLPSKPTVVFSDDPVQLHTVATLLGRNSDHVLIEATSLTDPVYHRFLQRRFGAKVPKVEPFPGELIISSPQNIQALQEMAATRELVYLHPSFGYFFEAFYIEPRQLTYVLKPYAPNAILAPAPAADLVTTQQNYWNSLRSGLLKDLKAELAKAPEGEPNLTVAYAGASYSRALDWWGMELQRAGRFDDAAPLFAEAVELNPDNAAAMINASANTMWRRERRRLPKLSDKEEVKLSLYRGDVGSLFRACGPVDEPSFLTELAATFTQNSLYRQAEQMLTRGLDYVPDDIALQLSLANVQVLSRRPDAAIATLTRMRGQTNWASVEPVTRIEAVRLEAMALLAKGDFAGAEKLLKSLVKNSPQHDSAHYALAQLYSTHATQLRDAGDHAAAAVQRTNALNVIEEQLKLQPTNAVAWFTCGNLAFYTGNYDRAVETFSKTLELTGRNKAALINRAVANLRSGMAVTNEARAAKIKMAKADYDNYRRQFTPDYRAYFGLGEIAYEEKDWKAAREFYEEYIKYANSAPAEERRHVRERIEALKKK